MYRPLDSWSFTKAGISLGSIQAFVAQQPKNMVIDDVQVLNDDCWLSKGNWGLEASVGDASFNLAFQGQATSALSRVTHFEFWMLRKAAGRPRESFSN